MPTKLFGGTLITTGEPDDADLLAFGQELLAGSKNMSWAYFKAFITLFTAVKAQSITVTGDAQTQAIDREDGEFVDLDVSVATGGVAITLSGFSTGQTMLINLTQGVLSNDLTFPVGTKTVNHTGGIITGISGANPQVIPIYFDGTNYVIQGFGEAQ